MNGNGVEGGVGGGAITIKSFKIPFSPCLKAQMCFVHLCSGLALGSARTEEEIPHEASRRRAHKWLEARKGIQAVL